jgi:hypothetical protein
MILRMLVALPEPAHTAASAQRLLVLPNTLSHGYQLIDGQWRIVHSHWALTQTTTEETTS